MKRKPQAPARPGCTRPGPDADRLFREALACHQSGDSDGAEARYRRLLARDPAHAGALHYLGVLANQRGEPAVAAGLIGQALALAPDDAAAHNNLGMVLGDLGQTDEEIACYRRALALSPHWPEARCNLGDALAGQDRPAEAEREYRQVLAHHPDHVEARVRLAGTLRAQGRFDEAITQFRRAVTGRPDHAGAWNNLGATLREAGDAPAACAAYREALRLRPELTVAHSNLLLALHSLPEMTPAELATEHRAFGRLHARPSASRAAGPDTPKTRLRVGYVSPDFREHSVSAFFEPLLDHHDRQTIEVVCYSCVRTPDAVTDRLRRKADLWVSLTGLDDDAAEARIRADAVDILVDLAGHTAGNRLPLLARRPAPIQVSWLGYPNTTGLPTMDYRLVDGISDPEGESDALATETLIRLPRGFLCYRPPDAAGPVSPLPMLATGTVTFGCFNTPAKLNAAVIRVWAALLRRLPGARLLLKGRGFGERQLATRLGALFEAEGIAADRILQRPITPSPAEHLACYDAVDIALDPFPYNGTTTTCEALWMGVPVVTLRGAGHAGRVGTSLLTGIGLAGLAAATVDDYVEIAAALAADPTALAVTRAGLRDRMRRAPLCDGAGFARQVETAYRDMAHS
jgi:predicted O-linked N-acetylglucosamine transferase (SPINDLY family)